MSKPSFRLHQSHSGYLLGRDGRTMLELRKVLSSGRKPTKAMEEGSLVDQLLYGGSTYCEAQTCTKRSGPEKGVAFEPSDWSSADAQEQREAARARGQVCVLKHEVDEALNQKQAFLETLLEEGIDLVSKHNKLMGDQLSGPPAPGVYTQPRIIWFSPEGIECEGTLDILEIKPNRRWRVVDTKLSVRADSEWASSQGAKMGWDVQAAAYIEACAMNLGLLPSEFDGYGFCICEKRSGLSQAAVHWLEDMFLHCGEVQWERCKHVWREALEKDEWTGVIGGPVSPPGYYVSRVFGDDGPRPADNLGALGLDVSDLDTEEP